MYKQGRGCCCFLIGLQVRPGSLFFEMSYSHSTKNFLGFLLGAAATAACILLLVPSAPCPCGVLPAPAHQESAVLGNGTTQADPPVPSMKKLYTQAGIGNSTDDHDLRELLKRASMDEDDRTIIMTFTNEAWTAPGSLLDLFLQSFRLGVRTAPLLKHLIVVAVDAKAYERCQHVHQLCYYFRVDGVDYAAEQSYMQKDYLDMMWRRNRFQARILELGYSFVFTDVDIIWLRNPLLRIPIGADMAMSCDAFYGDNPYDLNKQANGGFVYAKANARMVALYESWYESRKGYPGAHEQYVFDQVKHELSARHGVRVQFVDTAYLSGFCDLHKDFYRVCTVHANCLKGLRSKLQWLTEVFHEWKQFREKAALLGSSTTALTD